ncbi:hypothetical protein [Jonesia quinghaiensis]|uniref:hypothetical protein n=1 Tax=Jonesia quinghaiensis TaxID=262806 RepID=UPI00042A813B|nr:hypothetical protein [Jonesia quinghaiensis]
MIEAELTETLGISQPAVAKALKACESTPDVRELFAAGSAMELCQRYAAGLLSRDETVRQLSEWPFGPYHPANEFGEHEQDQSNVFMQVELAADFGLIDDAMYEEVVQRRMPG